MKTVLIGFKINSGVFTADDGKQVNYSNREVRFITDSGQDSLNVGFQAFTEKFKLSELASILHVQEDDRLVNDALNACVNKPVWVQFAPVGDKIRVVNFGLEQNRK